MDVIPRSWHLLLIGGASGIGRTRAGLDVANRYGVGASRLDDIANAVRRMTTPDQHLDLHYWWTHPEAAGWPAERILRLRLAFARALEPALEAVLEATARREPGTDHTKRARVSWLHGGWLARQAQRAGLLALPARPWTTQLEGILAAIGSSLDT